ncbi:MAG: carbamoyltransferase HypF [Thiomonas sp. 13-66-29]|jgi:hydrogenase maturation protein HypF|nr:MAG: carbamoyltransferase HypF [Thiomonas sp. 13-66-29]
MIVPADTAPERRCIRVAGVVQGVGFRPFVWRLARELGLAGWVRNDAAGVEIEVEGETARLAAFAERLRRDAPSLARVDSVDAADAPLRGGSQFAILPSAGGAAATAIPPDVATCADCLADLFDPADRRWRYAFTNCTQCGPRYTITRHLPYDRAQTSMAAFTLCPDCAAEYHDPASRRFHAEPDACPACGPRLDLRDAAGEPILGDPIAQTLRLLSDGALVALKGLGGFHLACDARNASSVARLRARKSREEKPFAVMFANLAGTRAFVTAGDAEAALLESPERPIVLLRKRPGCDDALPGVAPGIAWLGAMLPATPLQWLLFHDAAGRHAGRDWTTEPQALTLVMTSANPGGEPLVADNDEARTRLAGIADALLMHDRNIVIRCDDSVMRVAADGPRFLRRARGHVPRAIRLPAAGPSVLAVGGWFKNTVCVTRGSEAFVSQHIGDLDNAPTRAALGAAVEHLCDILDVEPAIVAHDLHPDYFSSRYAAEFAARRGLRAVAVQHHHAHVAAVLAEHGMTRPVIGLALDGVGLGTDGSAWGGELLRVDGACCTRLGHLRQLALPGGDRAARQPWRLGAAALSSLGRGDEIATRFADQPGAATVAKMLARGLNTPPTSSAGRLFDAAAALLGVRAVCSFEAQAAMLLEGLAERHGAVAPLAGGWRLDPDGTLDLRPLLAAIADCRDTGFGAALFHHTLAEALADWAALAAQRLGLNTVAAAGGCLLNAVLSQGLHDRLAARDLRLLQANQLPPNDGGLSLGQAWVAINEGDH